MDADPPDPDAATVIGAFSPTSQTGLTQVFPLWNPWMKEIHGQDVTLKALYGYLMPYRLTWVDNTATTINGSKATKVRLALLQMEVRDEDIVKGRFQQSFDIWSHLDVSRHRIRWMRDWIIQSQNPSGLDNSWAFWEPGIAANDAKGTGNEPLLAGLMGGPRVRLPRLRMRLTKDRPLCLAVGLSGNVPGGANFITNLGGDEKAVATSANARLDVTQFLRGFLVR